LSVLLLIQHFYICYLTRFRLIKLNWTVSVASFSLGPNILRYLKRKDATETVQLSFIISETGEVTDIKVLNKEEVHSKLAEEAVRVVKESYGWKPGTMYGEKISFMMKQGITFQVNKAIRLICQKRFTKK